MSTGTDTEPAVIAAGVYIPDFAVTTRSGELAVCNGDEDAVTLAIAAGARCGDLAGPASIEHLFLCLGHQPASDAALGEVVREALGLAPTAGVSVLTADPSAGAAGLAAVTDAVRSGRIRTGIVIASDAGDGKTIAAGAVALIVGRPRANGAGLRIEEQIEAGAVVYTTSRDAAGRRLPSDGRYLETSVVTTLAELLGNRAGRNGLPHTVVVAGGHQRAIAGFLDGHDVGRIGDFGVASPLLAILSAAGRVGAGKCAALALTPTRSVLLTLDAGSGLTEWLPELGLDRRRRTSGREPATSPQLSLPTNSPFFARNAGELLRLEAGRCENCGFVAFPLSQRPICSVCHHTTWAVYQLSRSGTVFTYTVNHILPVGFGDLMLMILGEMSDGSHYWAPASGIPVDQVSIGSPVSLAVRRYTDAGGNPAYAMKFVLDEQAASTAPDLHTLTSTV